jgi:hypothetical protein
MSGHGAWSRNNTQAIVGKFNGLYAIDIKQTPINYAIYILGKQNRVTVFLIVQSD